MVLLKNKVALPEGTGINYTTKTTIKSTSVLMVTFQKNQELSISKEITK
jgi:hypothetical protein